jgi:hypothetical protein
MGETRTDNNKNGSEEAIMTADAEGKANLIESKSLRVLSEKKTGKEMSWAV